MSARERRSPLGRLLGPLVLAGVLALKWGAKLKGAAARAAEAQAADHVGLDAGLGRGLRADLGVAVRGRVRRAAVHPRARALHPAAPRGRQADLHGLHPSWGAAVGARSLGGSAIAEARVGLAGPILGSLACAALLPVAAATDDPFWYALVFTGFFLNLFNLIPLVPFDGGRAMAAMAPWMWFAGFVAMVAFFVAFPNPILILFLLLGGIESWRRWKARRSGEEGNAAYYRVTPRQRLAVGTVYVGLIALLAVGMDASFVDRSDRL